MNPRQRLGLALCLAAPLWLAILLGLALLAPKAAPFRRGSAEVFWKAACGIPLGKGLLGGGGAYGPRDGWYFYDSQHMHGSDLFRVPEAEVHEHLGAALEELERRGRRGALRPEVQRGLEEWRKLDAGQRDAPALVTQLRLARQARWKAENPDVYHLLLLREQDCHQRWVRGRWYWATVAFEGVYLCGLVLFAVWPLLRGRGGLAWSCHLGALPFLFMLPVYLGYATAAYTSAGGGGVLYPHLLRRCTGSLFRKLDYAALPYVPQVLEPLSPAGGPPMSLSWRTAPGPVTMLTVGALIGVAVSTLRRWCVGEPVPRRPEGGPPPGPVPG